jgi:two-component system, LytTR family, sensor kinase
MRQISPTKRRWFWGGILFAVWTFMALLASVGTYVSHVGAEPAAEWGPILRQEFKVWYACGLVCLGVIWFCGRNRLQPGRAGRWVAIHFASALGFSFVYAVFTAWLVAGEKSVAHPGMILTFSYVMKHVCIEYVIMNMFVYWFVVFAHLGWHYYQRYREREAQAAELRRELVEARLESLRMQINPHFLFNTLHAVSALIHENPEAADRVVARLSDLLRLSLDQSKPQEVPLREELEFLDRYLEIEQTRFGDRLRVEKQVQPDALPALVPYLILQPLVENAIRHGIEPREDTGQLSIQARRNNGKLELRVTDNGDGLAERPGQAPREGIGLSNTRSRLHHLYGDKFLLELTSPNGGGLEARIDIPYRTESAST